MAAAVVESKTDAKPAVVVEATEEVHAVNPEKDVTGV
jgi:hypothetical protein